MTTTNLWLDDNGELHSHVACGPEHLTLVRVTHVDFTKLCAECFGFDEVDPCPAHLVPYQV